MADSMSEMLRRDMACEALLECFHGLKPIDEEVFGVLHEAGAPLTVDEVGERIGRERSTAYRSVRRLLEAGVVRKRQVNYDSGGYYHVYLPRDADEIAGEMRRMLNDWYAKVGLLIAEFDDVYADESEAVARDG